MQIGDKVEIIEGDHKDKVGIIKDIKFNMKPPGQSEVTFDFYMVEVINDDGSTEILPHTIELLKVLEK